MTRPPPRAHRSGLRRAVTIAVIAVLAIGLGAAVAVVVVTRMRTGQWALPTPQRVIAVRDQVIERFEPGPPTPKVIFLDRRPRTLPPGVDDAAAGVSSVIGHQGDVPRTVPGWKGSAKQWTQLVACVREQFARFDVAVSDTVPATREHLLVVVGGKAKDIGVKDPLIAGLAPFNGQVIPRAVVFSFAASQGHAPRAVCETIAMEVAHAYGLDHEYLCSDVMSYLKPCGKRGFVDKAAPCGEKKKRACAGGAPTQNSFRQLLAVLGPSLPVVPVAKPK